jgi:uncharacterized protein (DUF433 family)
MRLTIVLVAVLLAISVAVYANGKNKPAQPPSGAGPTEETTMPPATTTPSTTVPMTTMPMTSAEVEAFNTNLVVSTFGVDRNSVMQLRAAGWSWGDITLMANIAMQAKRPILEIAQLRSQGMAYSDIATRYNLSLVAITSAPSMVTTRVAGFTTEYGYQPIYYKTDPWGNPVLTRYDAERLSRLGYRWQDIAVAANISAETGTPVRDVLAWTDRGYTWAQVAREYGLSPNSVMDISGYPFAREGVTTASTVTTTTTTTAPVGAGPSMQPMPCPPASTVPTY